MIWYVLACLVTWWRTEHQRRFVISSTACPLSTLRCVTRFRGLDVCISTANAPSFLVWQLAPAQLPLMESERHTVEQHANNWRLFVWPYLILYQQPCQICTCIIFHLGGPRCGGTVHKDTKRSEQLLQIMVSTESSMRIYTLQHGRAICLLWRPYLKWQLGQASLLYLCPVCWGKEDKKAPNPLLVILSMTRWFIGWPLDNAYLVRYMILNLESVGSNVIGSLSFPRYLVLE